MKKIIGLLIFSSISSFANDNTSYDNILDTIKEDITLYQRSIPLSDKKNTCYHLGRVE
jgi:hypothetical protein